MGTCIHVYILSYPEYGTQFPNGVQTKMIPQSIHVYISSPSYMDISQDMTLLSCDVGLLCRPTDGDFSCVGLNPIGHVMHVTFDPYILCGW